GSASTAIGSTAVTAASCRTTIAIAVSTIAAAGHIAGKGAARKNDLRTVRVNRAAETGASATGTAVASGAAGFTWLTDTHVVWKTDVWSNRAAVPWGVAGWVPPRPPKRAERGFVEKYTFVDHSQPAIPNRRSRVCGKRVNQPHAA